MRRLVVDLFAGPGGWDVAAEALGISPLGIELDPSACATREAAGLRTLQGDVAALDPADYLPLHGLIASPPCQAFSMAGKGAGRAAIGTYRSAIATMARGEVVDVAALDEACGDERAHLVLEPLRWALATAPAWIALEQVPPVLPLWEAIATVLREVGYSVWTGLLTAEQYDVPQTRVRAILTARREGVAACPPPVRQRYIAPRRNATDSMFDTGRRVHPDDRDLRPWISMAEALGWGMTERPSVALLAKVGGRGGHRPLEGGSGARETLDRAREDGDWHPQDLVGFPRRNDLDDGGEYRERDLCPASEPAFALTEKTRSWQRWVVDTGNTRSGQRLEGRARPIEEPAPVVTSRSDQLEWREDEPDTRAWELRAGTNDHDPDESGSQYGAATVRVTIEEAAALQSFPTGYPWSGTKTARFTQVGNAIPPMLAWHILRSVIG